MPRSAQVVTASSSSLAPVTPMAARLRAANYTVRPGSPLAFLLAGDYAGFHAKWSAVGLYRADDSLDGSQVRHDGPQHLWTWLHLPALLRPDQSFLRGAGAGNVGNQAGVARRNGRPLAI